MVYLGTLCPNTLQCWQHFTFVVLHYNSLTDCGGEQTTLARITKGDQIEFAVIKSWLKSLKTRRKCYNLMDIAIATCTPFS